ncbi:hypothetical protein HID58_069757, partial [Brassica napus]
LLENAHRKAEKTFNLKLSNPGKDIPKTYHTLLCLINCKLATEAFSRERDCRDSQDRRADLVSFGALVTTLAPLSSDSLQQLNIDFNLDFYATSGPRRRRSTPTTRKQARLQKTTRHPVSDSDGDETASSMDSTAPTSQPVEDLDDDSSMQLPTRLFAPGCFPTALRLNIYSKANVIGAVAAALAGSPDMDVTVHFSLLPEAERHLWLDEVKDWQVTHLVHLLSSGHTFTTEDFRGRDKSFRTQGKQPENAPLQKEDQPEVIPIIQHNLQPRKPAAVVVEDLTSSEHNEPEVPHQSGSCPDKDLKLWISYQLQKMARGIYERLETMERNILGIYSHLGVSPPNVNSTWKRKADDANHGLSHSPKADGIQTQRPPGKYIPIHYALQTAYRLSERVKVSPNVVVSLVYNSDRWCTVLLQEPHTLNSVPDKSNSENPVTTATVYNPLIFVRPQSNVSPTKSGIDQLPCISDLTPTKRFRDEKPVTVTWEESNPHAFNSGKWYLPVRLHHQLCIRTLSQIYHPPELQMKCNLFPET